MFRALKAASTAIRTAACTTTVQRRAAVTLQKTPRPATPSKDIPPRVLMSHGIDSPRMKYGVLERVVGDLIGPKPVLYLTHSSVDAEMAQELVADLIAAKSKNAQVDVQTIEDFMSAILLSLLKTEDAKLLDSTDEALLLFKHFNSLKASDGGFRPEEVHRLVDFFRKLEYFEISPQKYTEYLTKKLSSVPENVARNLKAQQALLAVYTRFITLKESKKMLNVFSFSRKLQSPALTEPLKAELLKSPFKKYSHLVLNEPTLLVMRAMDRLQTLSTPAAANVTAIMNVVDFDTKVLTRQDLPPHINVIHTQLQYRAASLGIKQATNSLIQMLNISHTDKPDTSFIDYSYRTPYGKKNSNVFFFHSTSANEEIDNIGLLIQSLQNRYVNQFKLGYGDIRVVMSKEQIPHVAQQLSVKHKVPVVIENVLHEPEIRATLLFLQLIVDISYLELFTNKPKKLNESSEADESRQAEEARSLNINRALYELMTRYYGFDPEGEIKTVFLVAAIYRMDFFRAYPKLANGNFNKFTISNETVQMCNKLKLSLNGYVNLFRDRLLKPSELITEFIQKTIAPLKVATEQQKNNYARLIEVVNRFESQVQTAGDGVLAAVAGESKDSAAIRTAIGSAQGPVELANRKQLVMLLSFLSDMHVDQLPLSYLTSGVRLSTFDTIATTPTHTTIMIGSQVKYTKTHLTVPPAFIIEKPKPMSVKKQQIGYMFYNALRQTFHNLYVTNVLDVIEDGEVEHLQAILDMLKAQELNSLGLQSHLAGITSLLPPDLTKPEKELAVGTPSQWTSPFEVTIPHTLDRISFSSIVSYFQCPLQYCFKFVLRLRPTRYFDFQSAGQFLHEKIADFNEIRKDEAEKKSADKKVHEDKAADQAKKQEAADKIEKDAEMKEKDEHKAGESKEKAAAEKKESDKEKELKDKTGKEKDKTKDKKEVAPKKEKSAEYDTDLPLDEEEVALMASEIMQDNMKRVQRVAPKSAVNQSQPKAEVVNKAAATFVNFQRRESEKGKAADKMEQAFVIKLSEKVELTGTWDRIDQTEKGVIVTEYKTSIRNKRHHTMLQLMIYGWAYEQVYGVRPLKVVLESIETGEKFDYVPNYEDNAKLQTLFFQFANTLATNTFQATPSELKCSGCVYSNICPSALLRE